MSTNLYLECQSHTPPIRSSVASGQHDYDLPQIRADIRNRALIVAASSLGMSFEHDHLRCSTAGFLIMHETCNLAIIDEYERRHPIDQTQDDE